MKVSALLAVVVAHPAISDARHTPRHLKKIVNGEEAAVGAYPFMVQLVDVGCGGSVIDAHWVLTAAHCEFQENIVVGAHYWYGMEGQYLQVTANFKHPEYNSQTFDQDFQLLYIEEGIDLELFPPVELNTDDSMYPAGTSLTIAGWGTVESGGDASSVLLEATVDVVDQGVCNTNYEGVISDNMLCAAADGTDTCQGDSGGPIFDVKEDGSVVQVGVVSWGYGCADALYPGVYARVSTAIDWIRETISEGPQCLDVCCGNEVDCESCAEDFLQNGGCNPDLDDVTPYIPIGCESCGEEAEAICEEFNSGSYGSYDCYEGRPWETEYGTCTVYAPANQGGTEHEHCPNDSDPCTGINACDACPTECAGACGAEGGQDSSCGCEMTGVQFCNHDFGLGDGNCEDCSNFADVMDCYTDGLPTDGESSCVEWCFFETRKLSGTKENSNSGRHLLFGDMDECPSACMDSLLCPDDDNVDSTDFQCDSGCTIPLGYVDDGFCDCSNCEDETAFSCADCSGGCPVSDCNGEYTGCQ